MQRDQGIEGRLEMGESSISMKASYSCYYALNVLHGRFPAGEPAIATDPWCSCKYAYDVIHGRFRESERTILNSKYALEYRGFIAASNITDVLNRDFMIPKE